MAMSVYGIATQILNVYLSRDDLEALLEHTIDAFVHIFILTKVSIMFLKTNDIQNIVKTIEGLQKTQLQEIIMEQYLINAQHQSWKYSLHGIIILHSFSVLAHIAVVIGGFIQRDIPFR
jgi:lipoate synthase